MLGRAGTFLVTAATYGKAHHFRGRERLAVLQRVATPAQIRTISRFKTDKLKIVDDYEPDAEW
jgi:hypothetical protein